MKSLTKNTYLLTLTSLFADISTEMLYPILPIFLTAYLGASGTIVGLIEGLANATQNIQMGVAGVASDKMHERRPLAIAGYTIAAVAKPFIGLAQIWPVAFVARILDRFGTGTRSAPRDALIAASADNNSRGKAFGLEGIGDNLGAFLGPLIAALLLFYVKVPIRSIFYLAMIPGILAVILVFLVKEKKDGYKSKVKLTLNFKDFPKSYWKYIGIIAIFGIGNISSSFMILQTKNIGIPLVGTILIYAVFNLIAALVSYPSGSLSDKFGRQKVLLISFVVFILALIGFTVTRNFWAIAFFFGLYGVYQGIFRTVGKAYAADFVDEDERASAIGFFNTTVGISGIVAGILAGVIYDSISSNAVFATAAFFATLGALLI